MTDEFEHVDQHERSWSHPQEYGPQLAGEASDILRDTPEANLAGVILEAGTSEYAWFRARLAEITRKELNHPILAGIVAKETMLSIVGDQGREWLAESAGASEGKLAILVATKDGMRFGLQPLSNNGDR